jgi:phospholipase D-like protein
MIRVLPFTIELFLLVFCLIDAIQSDPAEIRNLPKLGWIALIVIVPVVGGIAWLAVGRPLRRPASGVRWPATRTSGSPGNERPARSWVAPDDDPEFLRTVGQANARDPEQEELLRRWEDDLRRRERDLRGDDGPRDDDDPRT